MRCFVYLPARRKEGRVWVAVAVTAGLSAGGSGLCCHNSTVPSICRRFEHCMEGRVLLLEKHFQFGQMPSSSNISNNLRSYLGFSSNSCVKLGQDLVGELLTQEAGNWSVFPPYSQRDIFTHTLASLSQHSAMACFVMCMHM